MASKLSGSREAQALDGVSLPPHATNTPVRPMRRRLMRFTARRVGLGLVLLACLSLAPHFRSSTELVRVRNAWLVMAGPTSDFEWTPVSRPAGFAVETAAPDPVFAEAVRRLNLDHLPDDGARVRAISAHLLGTGKARVDGAIQSDLRATYWRIVEHGEGYCADFVRTFNALAITAGIPVRSWAFSFDGFGGHGHVFPEIWNRQAVRWELLDPFSNLEFLDTADQPLSALAFRQALRDSPGAVRFRTLVPGAPTEFVHLDKAREYFARGADHWYLWWGERPFTYDAAPGVRWLEGWSRSLAQLTAMAQGVFPRIRILETPSNRPDVLALERVRFRVGAAAVVALVGLLLMIKGSISSARRSRPAQRKEPS